MTEARELPFKMSLDNSLSVWRADTFWSKEPETIEWIKFFALTNDYNCKVLVDVGANVGIYTLYWCSLDSSLSAISVEPSQNNLNLLTENIFLNEFTKRVRIINTPLASQNFSGFYEESDHRPGSSSFKFYPDADLNPERGSAIRSLTLDSLFNESLGSKILKIDVDGNDFDILKGAEKSLIAGDILSVLIESSIEQQNEIKKYLEKFGYESDKRFNGTVNHSDVRRIAKGNIERNRIYTNFSLLNSNFLDKKRFYN